MSETTGPIPETAGAPATKVSAEVTQDDRTYALFMHLSLLAHLVMSIVAVLIPLVMWLVKRERSAFLDDHGREALNFQITMGIYSILIIPIAVITCGFGAVLYVGLYALAIVGMILAAVAANRGEYYRYPMTIRLVR